MAKKTKLPKARDFNAYSVLSPNSPFRSKIVDPKRKREEREQNKHGRKAKHKGKLGDD